MWNLKKQKEKGHTQEQTVEWVLPGAGAEAMGRYGSKGTNFHL